MKMKPQFSILLVTIFVTSCTPPPTTLEEIYGRYDYYTLDDNLKKEFRHDIYYELYSFEDASNLTEEDKQRYVEEGWGGFIRSQTGNTRPAYGLFKIIKTGTYTSKGSGNSVKGLQIKTTWFPDPGHHSNAPYYPDNVYNIISAGSDILMVLNASGASYHKKMD